MTIQMIKHSIAGPGGITVIARNVILAEESVMEMNLSFGELQPIKC